MCIYIYLSIRIYIYTYVSTCISIYIYIYVYIEHAQSHDKYLRTPLSPATTSSSISYRYGRSIR